MFYFSFFDVGLPAMPERKSEQVLIEANKRGREEEEREERP